jgi:hypothetical protein
MVTPRPDFFNVKRCARCILPDTLLGIRLDDEGICNYCREYERDFGEWHKIEAQRQKEFEDLLLAAKRLKRPYDCLVPLSGGKDSTYALFLCSKHYKLRCLAVTFDNGYLSNRARINISNAMKATNADHVFYQIGKENATQLYATFLRKTGSLCNACMRGISYSIRTTATAFRIPLIVMGSGRRVQYVSQIKDLDGLEQSTATFFRNVLHGEPVEPFFRHFARNEYRSALVKIFGRLCHMLKIKRTGIMRLLPQYVDMYDYVYKPFPEIVEILKKEMGWLDHEGTVEHMDCYLHSLPFYGYTVRVNVNNITTKTFHDSGLIRQGILSRDEAMKNEERRFNNEMPPDELKAFLDQNNMSLDSYIDTVKHADNNKYTPAFLRMLYKIYSSVGR